jgi:hypothetical protein
MVAGVTDNVVWAIGERLLHNYLLPRDCPRVTYYSGPATQESDRERFFPGTRARHVVAVEQAWYPHIRSGRLWRYELPPTGFVEVDPIADYHVSRSAVEPRSEEIITDILAALLDRDVELRFLPSLWPLRDQVLASSLHFSFIRMRNAQPRP